MRAILHVHTWHSADCFTSPRRVLAAAQRLGVDFLLVSDHDSFRGAREVRYWAHAWRTQMYVPLAAEVRTQFGDVLIAFDDDVCDVEIAALKDFHVLAEVAASRGGVLVLPHPFHQHPDPHALARKVDAIEAFNGRSNARENLLASELCESSGRVGLAGADAHFVSELGSAVNQYPDVRSVAVLRTAPKIVQRTSTYRYRIALSSAIKALRGHRPLQAARYTAAAIRDYGRERRTGRSSLTAE